MMPLGRFRLPGPWFAYHGPGTFCLRVLPLLIGFDVPAHFAARSTRAVRLLFLVIDVELGEVDRDVFREQVGTVTGRLHAADEDVHQLDLQVFQGFLTRLADRDQTVGNMFAVAAE